MAKKQTRASSAKAKAEKKPPRWMEGATREIPAPNGELSISDPGSSADIFASEQEKEDYDKGVREARKKFASVLPGPGAGEEEPEAVPEEFADVRNPEPAGLGRKIWVDVPSFPGQEFMQDQVRIDSVQVLLFNLRDPEQLAKFNELKTQSARVDTPVRIIRASYVHDPALAEAMVEVHKLKFLQTNPKKKRRG